VLFAYREGQPYPEIPSAPRPHQTSPAAPTHRPLQTPHEKGRKWRDWQFPACQNHLQKMSSPSTTRMRTLLETPSTPRDPRTLVGKAPHHPLPHHQPGRRRHRPPCLHLPARLPTASLHLRPRLRPCEQLGPQAGPPQRRLCHQAHCKPALEALWLEVPKHRQ